MVVGMNPGQPDMEGLGPCLLLNILGIMQLLDAPSILAAYLSISLIRALRAGRNLGCGAFVWTCSCL